MATKDLSIAERELIDKSLEFIKSLTIKNPYMVNKYETADTARFAETYLYILDDRDNVSFEYFTYTVEDLKAIGIDNLDLLKTLSEDNRLIPDFLKPQLLENKLNYYERDYVEQNDYYRMLNGLPSINALESDYIYVTVNNIEGESVRKPIHELTDKEFYQIDLSGEYDKLLAENPTLQYLYYIHPNRKISFYTARKTKDFYIMGYNNAIMVEEHTKEIIDLYYEVMVYTMSVIYSNAHTDNEYYDSYIILYMLHATLQRFFSKNIENIIRRDVYDLESVKNIYASYGLPFFEEIPLKYQRKIVKNINRLLSYKGTNQIFIDLADIFGFTDTELYKYYLVKDFIRDDGGVPVTLDENDLDNIELKFAQVSTEENDISSYLKQDMLYQTYEEVVSDDPYWGEEENGEIDEELIEEIKQMEFNYLSTKYLSTTTIFNMSECAYEAIYFFNFLNKLFKDKEIDHLYFYDTNIKDNGEPIYLYSMITALYILLFRRFGYKDVLPSTVTGVASVYGFNFDTEFEELKNYVKEKSTIDVEGQKIHYWWQDPEIDKLIKILDKPNNPTKAELLNSYFSNKKVDKVLEEAINETDDYRIYKALDAVHTYTMYSQAIKDVYGEGYGTTNEYETFTDWLRDNDVILYKWVEENTLDNEGNIDKNKTIKALDDVLDVLDMYFYSDEFTYLFTNMNVTIDLVRKYFIQMISVFKAYTVELKKVNIYYLFNDKFLNTIRLYAQLKVVVNTDKADSIEKEMAEDILQTISFLVEEGELLKLEEFIVTIINLYKEDRFKIGYKEELFKEAFMDYADSIEYNFADDLYFSATYHFDEEEKLNLEDLLINHIYKYPEDRMTIVERIYKNTASNPASAIPIDDKQYVTEEKNFFETNKIINNDYADTISIQYSYVD